MDALMDIGEIHVTNHATKAVILFDAIKQTAFAQNVIATISVQAAKTTVVNTVPTTIAYNIFARKITENVCLAVKRDIVVIIVNGK